MLLKKGFIKMKKLLSILLVLVFALSFAACSQEADKSGDSNTADSSSEGVSISDIGAKIVKDVNVAEAKELDKDMVSGAYGINADDIADCSCYQGSGTVFPDEIVIIKAKDDTAASSIKTSLETYLGDLQDQSKDYGSEEDKYALDCGVFEEGDIIAMFISADHAQMEQIFNDSVK